MAGGTPGQVGGGGGGSTGLEGTSSSDFSQNALNTGTPGGQPGSPDFVGNAMTAAGGGGAPAAIVGTQNDPSTQSQLTGLYASTVNPATTPYGQSSGNTNPMAQLGEQIGKFLFGGAAQAAQPSRPGGPAGGDVKGPSWFTPQTGPGTDQYGNTYTSVPGYQGMPTHPLPPATQPAATPRAYAAPEAPVAAPAAPATPAPKADTGGGTIKPAAPTPTATNTPPPAKEEPTPPPKPGQTEEYQQSPTPPPGPEISPQTAEAIGASTAPVSPQSVPASGNKDVPIASGTTTVEPETVVGKILSGDLAGTLGDLAKSALQGLGILPADSLMRGATTPQQLAIARGAMSPGVMANPGEVTGLYPQQIRAGSLLPGVPPETASTAQAYQIQNQPPRGTTGFTSIDQLAAGAPSGPPVTPATFPPSPLNQSTPTPTPAPTPAPAPNQGGGAEAAPVKPYSAMTPAEKAQWQAGFQNWRVENHLPDNEQTRAQYEKLRAQPAQPPKPQTSTTPAQQSRKPSYGEYLRANGLKASDQNFIRYRNAIGDPIGRPPQAGYKNPAVVEAAANVSQHFPRGDWQKFEREARPSTNVIQGPGNVREPIFSTGWSDEGRGVTYPEPSAADYARFDPKDPMTRSLMGSDRSKMQNEVLQNMTPEEFRLWSNEIRKHLMDVLHQNPNILRPPQ